MATWHPAPKGGRRKEIEFGNAGSRGVRNVVDSTITVFLPDPRTATGAGVIIAPGGGFRFLQRRFGHAGKRLRKIGIVALERKLLIALWRCLETWLVPNGAELKPSEV